jgi:hypothetical protein
MRHSLTSEFFCNQSVGGALLALDVDEHFIEQPVISQGPLYSSQFAGKLLPESATSTENRLVADGYSAQR